RRSSDLCCADFCFQMLSNRGEREVFTVQTFRQDIRTLLAFYLEIDQHEFWCVVPFIDVFRANRANTFLHAHFLAHHDTMWLHAEANTLDFLYRKFIHLAFN